MKRKAVLVRFIILAGIVAAVAVVIHERSRLPLQTLSPFIDQVKPKVMGIAEDLNIDPAKIVDQAQKKLVDRQPIMEDNSSQSSAGEVMGSNTTLGEQAKQIIQDAVNDASTQIKQLPKEEAAKITRQVCEQIIYQLEKD